MGSGEGATLIRICPFVVRGRAFVLRDQRCTALKAELHLQHFSALQIVDLLAV